MRQLSPGGGNRYALERAAANKCGTSQPLGYRFLIADFRPLDNGIGINGSMVRHRSINTPQ
jgi:hypothetical protein